jgi:hypothetical protein
MVRIGRHARAESFL